MKRFPTWPTHLAPHDAIGHTTRRAIHYASLLALLLLAACGGQPSREGGTSGESEATASRGISTATRRGGGYYKDDGPADDTPDNLDSIPDAQPMLEPLHRFANKPYVVLGKSYVPATQLVPYRRRGVASWYGKKFHGQKTSIGEPYDMFAMTAAHPTLAIPSYARVTNVSNGRSVVVRVTDRGPFHADRIIDLSYAAAHRLGYVNKGSTLVDVESIIPDDVATSSLARTKPATPPPVPAATESVVLTDEPDAIESLATTLTKDDVTTPVAKATGDRPVSANVQAVFLQLGAFSNADNAENLRAHLTRELDWLEEEVRITTGSGMFRVRLGPFATRADAARIAEKIRATLGYKPAFVTR